MLNFVPLACKFFCFCHLFLSLPVNLIFKMLRYSLEIQRKWFFFFCWFWNIAQKSKCGLLYQSRLYFLKWFNKIRGKIILWTDLLVHAGNNRIISRTRMTCVKIMPTHSFVYQSITQNTPVTQFSVQNPNIARSVYPRIEYFYFGVTLHIERFTISAQAPDSRLHRAGYTWRMQIS